MAAENRFAKFEFLYDSKSEKVNHSVKGKHIRSIAGVIYIEITPLGKRTD